MRAQVLERPAPVHQRPLQLRDRLNPEATDDELVLRVAACGVCRTDLQLATGDLAPRRLPVILGHQAVGRVERVGAAVSGWQAGDRAGMAWLAGACGECGHCLTGRENLCAAAQFTGWDRDGGYAERIAVRADFALRIPEGFDDMAAAPLLCGGVIGYRSLKISGIRPGGRLGLYGFGASATLAIQIARHWGCEVYVATRSRQQQRQALELGATWVGDIDELPPRPLDAAITFAPVGEVVVAALRAVERGGTVAINAIHLDRIPEFPYELLWWERTLRSVANFTRQDAQEFLSLAAAIPLITAVEAYPLAEANEALARLSAGELSGALVLTL